jgi:hypothetical protein
MDWPCDDNLGAASLCIFIDKGTTFDAKSMATTPFALGLSEAVSKGGVRIKPIKNPVEHRKDVATGPEQRRGRVSA